MRTSGIYIAGTAIALIGLALFLNVQFFEKKPLRAPLLTTQTETNDMESAERLLREGVPESALEIISNYIPTSEMRTPTAERWITLLVQACEECKEVAKLRTLYESSPEILAHFEKASLLVAESYIAQGKVDQYNSLRNRWVDRERLPDSWILLDSDKLLLEGKQGQANNLLGAQSFTGKAEVDRLTRLALLNANDNPTLSWRYLNSAQQKDPDNRDIRFYKGKLLESVGKNSLAFAEYEAAATSDPSNLFLQDQLAEFYLRQGQFKEALHLWSQNLDAPSMDAIWIKALFWSRVLFPANIDWEAHTPPQGRLQPYVSYLINLPPKSFWSRAEFNKLPLKTYYIETQQSAFWLRLIDALKAGREQEAATLVNENSFTVSSWNPELEYLLKQILTYREKGRLDIKLLPPALTEGKERSTLLSQLENFAVMKGEDIPDNLHELILSKEVFSAAFLAAGWTEAGLDLHKLHLLPRHFPDWVAVQLTKAYQQNRSDLDAIDFASVQPKTAPLTQLMAEMYLAGGDTESALKLLLPYTNEYTDIGYQASWLVSQIYSDQGKFDSAKELIDHHPKLAASVQGKEALAKIALAKGEEERALSIYNSIAARSVIAKTYLAQKAFSSKNWDQAKQFTEELIKLYPNNKQLKSNLQRIEQEMAKQALTS